MASSRLSFVVVAAALVVSAGLMPQSAVAELKTDYYASTCPNLEVIVRSSVKQSMAQSPISAPAALRLFFHDCAVRGCDASIMIVNSNGDDEWRNSDNQSLKPEGFQTILNAKAAVDSDPQCRYKVSCADIMALAARESVYQSGGPYYEVELGRYDGRVSTRDGVVLPHANFNLDQLNAFFSGLGFTQPEMVALSGAHTIGAADCPFFQYRIGNDATMDPGFASQLNGTCSSDSNAFAFLDPSPVGFDNAFYQNLQVGKGLLGSDQVLYSDMRSRSTVDYYTSNQGAFFDDFVAAMTKLGRIGVKTPATGGEIRQDCQFPN
ncbi:peroxidase 45-like [Miscanthus floridulus]|uniref:peroxidase 45-like n=1 Tax=Miscanthus floridulus TaxID=154761 RepID=UPI0034599E17